MKKILVSLFLLMQFAAYAQLVGTPYIPFQPSVGNVSDYTCTTDSAGTLIVGTPVSAEVTQTITATVTKVGIYRIFATANGVTFFAIGTFTAIGNQPIVLTATGTPIAKGSNDFTLNTTPNCSFSRYASVTGVYANVNGTFKDFATHNLGANTLLPSFSYVSVLDEDGSEGTLGYLYQWGRQTDGHELRTSKERKGPEAAPVSNRFITNSTSPKDWLDPQKNDLWGDGTNGADPPKTANDPCPTGFKVPSQAQWSGLFVGGTTSGAPGTATQNTWTWTGKGYMIGSNLYLPAAGFRNSAATLGSVATSGYYWSSRVNIFGDGTGGTNLYFFEGYVYPNNNAVRVNGFSVRCIAE